MGQKTRASSMTRLHHGDHGNNIIAHAQQAVTDAQIDKQT